MAYLVPNSRLGRRRVLHQWALPIIRRQLKTLRLEDYLVPHLQQVLMPRKHRRPQIHCLVVHPHSLHRNRLNQLQNLLLQVVSHL